MRRNHNFFYYGALVIIAALLIAFIALLTTPTQAYEGEAVRTARQERLHDAAELLRELGFTEDSDAIRQLQAAWWREQEDLDIIAKVIQNEADPAWCKWEHSVAVGAVVVNRVRSPYFPNTVKEVVAAPGQYLPTYTRGFEGTIRLAYLAAKDALDGNHDVPSDAYWQDNTIQGVHVWKAFVLDTGWFRSTTYICTGIPGID